VSKEEMVAEPGWYTGGGGLVDGSVWGGCEIYHHRSQRRLRGGVRGLTVDDGEGTTYGSKLWRSEESQRRRRGRERPTPPTHSILYIKAGDQAGQPKHPRRRKNYNRSIV
jgi:hypothetical protein